MTRPSVRLVAVGDVMVTRPIGRGDGFLDPAIRHAVGQADIAFANLEVPLTDRGYPADKTICFRSPPRLAEDLAGAGFDIVTLANNHALDFGIDGLRQTLDTLRSAGVRVVGAGENAREAFRDQRLDRNGVTISFLGMACTLPPGFVASDTRPGTAGIRVVSQFVVDPPALDEQPGMAPFVRTWAVPDDVRLACDAVKRAKARADVVVVAIHWGVPLGWVAAFQDPLAEYQRPLARALAESGADLVVGHHPHCLHGVERRDRTWILYSVGNFVFHTLGPDQLSLSRPYPPYRLDSLSSRQARESALFDITLSDGSVDRIEVRPVLLDDTGEPYVLAGDEAGAVLDRLDGWCGPLGTAVSADGGRAVLVERQ